MDLKACDVRDHVGRVDDLVLYVLIDGLHQDLLGLHVSGGRVNRPDLGFEKPDCVPHGHRQWPAID